MFMFKNIWLGFRVWIEGWFRVRFLRLFMFATTVYENENYEDDLWDIS